MSASRLRELLRARGREWPGELEWLEVVSSTNDLMRERARTAPAWSALLAGRQTSGRGRRGHVWASPPGNLYLSVLVPPPENVRSRALMPLVAGLAVVLALDEFGVRSELKWPNDVQAAGRKLAGISAEATLGDAAGLIVLGIGVNVREHPGVVDASLGASAVALAHLTAAVPDPIEVAAAVLLRLHEKHAELLAGSAAALLDAWRARSVPWWGRPVEVVFGGESLRGTAVGVDESGALLLELPDGRREAVLAGEARELRLGGR